MDKQTPYLTQYCNLAFEWYSTDIEHDSATESQKKQRRELRAKAVEQSGLTCNEVTLICLCRQHRIFNKVNVYAHKLKSL